MASEPDHNAVYNDDDDDDDEPLNDVVLDDDAAAAAADEEDADSPDSDDSDDADTNSTSSAAVIAPTNGSDRPRPPPAVTHGASASASSVAAPSAAIVAMSAPSAVAATPVSERRPVDDSRRLFQRLWTDEDEIELLQGFLEYTSQRGPNWSGHHHDTTAFYDQIKSKLQLDCNKNQLVEKLRRLKKKYRNVVGRISSGKDFLFKSPHDQATFEISRKIWSNSIANRPEFDDDEQNPNPSSAADHRTPASFPIDVNSPNKMTTMMMMMNNMAATPPNTSSRKRPRVKVEEKTSRNANPGVYEPVNLTPVAPTQISVEETVKSYLSPLLKKLADTVPAAGVNGITGAKGIASLASIAIPMNFPGANLGNGGEIMEERWRKQQILELEVYSKRLELVQDQIKLALGELRTIGN